MTLAKVYQAIIAILMFVFVACGSPARVEPTVAPTLMPMIAPTTAPTMAPTSEPPTETASVLPTAPVTETTQLSFTPTTYSDESAGFKLAYPAGWTLDPSSQIGVRGGQALLFSPGTTLETLANGGTRISITTYIWDPKNDLDSYVAQRKVAWDASGFTITREEQWQLADGRSASVFVVRMPELSTFTLFTTIGEDYLQISGEGDLALVEEIAKTLQPLH